MAGRKTLTWALFILSLAALSATPSTISAQESLGEKARRIRAERESAAQNAAASAASPEDPGKASAGESPHTTGSARPGPLGGNR